MTYRSLLRPVSTFTLPADIGGWWYVEIPAEFSMNRPEMPVSRHRYGTFATERPLTAEELTHFSIEEIKP
jgi:hypothetical protein